MVNDITDAAFEREVLQSPVPVLVDFYADWCEPCKAFASTIEDVAASFAGDRLRVVKMNIQDNPDAPTAFGIRTIPALILFKDGKPFARRAGSVPKKEILDWIREALK